MNFPSANTPLSSFTKNISPIIAETILKPVFDELLRTNRIAGTTESLVSEFLQFLTLSNLQTTFVDASSSSASTKSTKPPKTTKSKEHAYIDKNTLPPSDKCQRWITGTRGSIPHYCARKIVGDTPLCVLCSKTTDGKAILNKHITVDSTVDVKKSVDLVPREDGLYNYVSANETFIVKHDNNLYTVVGLLDGNNIRTKLTVNEAKLVDKLGFNIDSNLITPSENTSTDGFPVLPKEESTVTNIQQSPTSLPTVLPSFPSKPTTSPSPVSLPSGLPSFPSKPTTSPTPVSLPSGLPSFPNNTSPSLVNIPKFVPPKF